MSRTLEDSGIRRALDAIDAGTQRLTAAVAECDEAALRAPSALPGWSRGHVATHVARNAEAFVNLIMQAADGKPRPMYASVTARNEGIEAGADRPGPELVTDLRTTADRFLWAARELPTERWSADVTLLNGRTVPVWFVLGGRMR